MKNLCGILVREFHVLKFDLAINVRQLDSIGLVALGLGVDDLKETLKAGYTVLILLHKADEGVDGRDKEVDRDHKGGVFGDRDASRVDEKTARDEDDYVENVGDEGRSRVELTHSIVSFFTSVDEGVVADLEFFGLLVLIGVSLGNADARDRAFKRGVYHGVGGAALGECGAHLLAEIRRNDD